MHDISHQYSSGYSAGWSEIVTILMIREVIILNLLIYDILTLLLTYWTLMIIK